MLIHGVLVNKDGELEPVATLPEVGEGDLHVDPIAVGHELLESREVRGVPGSGDEQDDEDEPPSGDMTLNDLLQQGSAFQHDESRVVPGSDMRSNIEKDIQEVCGIFAGLWSIAKQVFRNELALKWTDEERDCAFIEALCETY